MHVRRPELAVLDVTGTTIDEGSLVYRTLEETAVAHGATPSKDELVSWHGARKDDALRALLAPVRGSLSTRELSKVVDDFHARLFRAYDEHPPSPLPEIPEALATLRDAGIRVVLTTGFDRDVIDLLLETVGWAEGETIDGVVSGSDVSAGRPAPYMIHRAMELTGTHDVRRVLTAGDTPRDLEAGVNSGAQVVVGVLTGAASPEELMMNEHTHLLRSVTDIPTLRDVPEKNAGGHD